MGPGSCTWPVLREASEQPCGRRAHRMSDKARRCWQHREARTFVQVCLDPLGPYVAQVESIEKKIRHLRKG